MEGVEDFFSERWSVWKIQNETSMKEDDKTRRQMRFIFFLVLGYSIPLLSQIKTKVHSNVSLSPGGTATWH